MLASSAYEAGTIVGSYKLISVLGEGAVGRVYLAEHIKLGRRVALKMLRRELSHHPKLLERFFLEARAVNEVAHENIVTITDIFEGSEEHPAYFIMELLHGLTLDRLIREEGPQSARFTATIGAQLASAIAAVHSKGFIHRDVKPANIYLVPRDNGYFVKLLDFGVAKLVAGGRPQGDTTAVGDLVGTPDYMAPEQARAMTVDARTDIYALGIVLYETITGERPFRGDTIDQVLKAQILEQAVPPSTKRPLPGALERLILRCLEKAPDARPQSAAEIETELRAIAATLAKPTKKLDRKSWGIWLLFFAVAIAAGIAWAIR